MHLERKILSSYRTNLKAIFSQLNTPGILFQTWPRGPGIYLSRAVDSSPVFIILSVCTLSILCLQ